MKKKLIGLDLLKTIAILSVLVYHINPKILSGGFIGVDLFFVVSGYLLGHSLIKHKDKSLKELILKRIGQLWLPLFLVIVATTIYITLFNKPVLVTNSKHILYGLTFTSNWGFIFNNVGYFDSYIVNPYKHLWYISVLIQSTFIIQILFKLFGKIKIGKYNLFIIIMVLIFGYSLASQMLLVDMQNVSRVYYGTDTRIYTILTGLLAYFIYPFDELKKPKTTKQFILINLASFVALGLYIFLSRYVIEYDEWVYRWGFQLFAINSLALVLTFGDDVNLITRLFGELRFLLYPGKISYEIYLWHYPIIVLSQFASEAAQPNPVYSIIRAIITFAIAKIMYDYIGSYLSRQGFLKTLDKKGWIFLLVNPIIYPFVILFALGSFGISVPFLSTAFIDTSRDVVIKENLVTADRTHEEVETQEIVVETNDNTESEEISESSLETSSQEDPVETIEESKLEIAQSTTDLKYSQLILVGDSVSIYIGENLLELYPNTIVDAKVSRQLYDSAEVVAKYSAYDSENTALIIMLGTNGVFTEDHLDELISTFPKAKKVFVNTKMPNVWEPRVNKTLADYVASHPEYTLVDWYSTAIANPQYLASDRTHLMPDGATALTNLILDKLR